jgi:hypothetical protein
MQVRNRRRALESAGKIALGFYFGAVSAACGGLSEGGRGGSLELEPGAGGPLPSATSSATSSATPSATGVPEPNPPPPVPELACLGPIEVFEQRLVTPLTGEADACCHSYVQSVVSADPTRPDPELALDPSLLNCCRALAYGASFDQTVAHDTCCYGQVLPTVDRQANFCSPWGPPVPPALVLS